MALVIAQLGQPVLRAVAAPLVPEEIGSAEVQQLIDEMLQTLGAERGAGLAAPQVFVGRRLFLARVEPPREDDLLRGVEVFINPRLTASGEPNAGWEGCLSFPELAVLVERPRRVRVEYLDRHGEPRALELEDMPARVVQHENDHLDGVLTIDRAASPRDIVKASELETVLRSRAPGG